MSLGRVRALQGYRVVPGRLMDIVVPVSTDWVQSFSPIEKVDYVCGHVLEDRKDTGQRT